MSILIKGMEMPPDCEKCPFFDYEEGFCFASGIKGKSGWYEYVLRLGGIKDGRHDDCPLVEIPPHGRLIDADAAVVAIQNSIEVVHDGMQKILLDYAQKMFNTTPTIIPAEEDSQ